MTDGWFIRLLDAAAQEGRWTRKLFFRFYSGITSAAFYLTLLLYPVFCLLSWVRLGIRKLLRLKPAVLWAAVPILNIVESSRLMQKLGYRSRSLVFTVYFITNKFDHNLQRYTYNPIASPLLPNFVFLWSLLRFDVYQFFYDGGLWSGMKIVPRARWLEFPLLRLAGKRIVANAYGADVRTRLRDEMWRPWNLCMECPEPGKHCLCEDHAGIVNTKYYRDWCNELIAMGDMHDYVYGSRPDFVHWPIDVNAVAYVGAQPQRGRVVVAHSPNHRHFKGTRFIEAAVAALREKGYDVELDIIERVSNDEAKRRYAAADIVFAQCILGWPGFTEIEAMAAGKPVLTYVRDEERYLAHVPGWAPISVTPDNAQDVLEGLLRDPERRAELGRQGRAHVEKYWSYEACAPSYIALHDKLWRQNGLGAVLRAKRRDIRLGEEQPRLGKGLADGELPVWTDPAIALDRVNWGLYGQPVWDDEGLLQVNTGLHFQRHLGVIAKFAIDSHHAMAIAADAPLEQALRRHVDWLRQVARDGSLRDMAFMAAHGGSLARVPEAPQRTQASRMLAYAALMLAHARYGVDQGYAEAAQEVLASALDRSSPTCALHEGENGASLLHEGDEIGQAQLPSLALTAIVLASVPGQEALARETAHRAASLLAGANLDQLVATRRFGVSDFFDEVYFVAVCMRALGRQWQREDLARLGDATLRTLAKRRWRNFLRFIAPL
ncbi:glycosyltransferase family protein [Bordetella hinzii]|uniref:Spore protein YkvP/CgeB glycosyl transferase-like domain-containing protein n=1 Tax=Bordetella hinzii TaxID=103855 RepID=A0AAN1VFM3_9BORD|nr:glycosyltransferase [Bordetella hinzii]AKQ58011.1 hypothetical protein ACR55_00094 [Bordetella hinzii]AZW16632.1 hypothetical protein CS347_07565 [Bordetella hinzii]KCB46224.1 glycosyltransferase, group 1 family protein [Bordetella hinzii 4161]KXA73682.1 hypothetical protein AXA74_06645 [Bordetella hinzii LMG 13501]MBZ0074073.1 glycosyltransferase family 4 protein [Bordetella hinzii]